MAKKIKLPRATALLEGIRSYLVKRGISAPSGLAIVHSRAKDTQNRKDPRAFCCVVGSSPKIHCALAIEHLDSRAIIGILLHEIAHTIVRNSHVDAEVGADEWVIAHIPESKFTYADVAYRPAGRRARVARNIEVVSSGFVTRIIGEVS